MRKICLSLISILILGFASPALAQTGVTARVTSPSDGSVVVGSVTTSATGSATTGVRNIKLFIEGTLVASKAPSELRQNVDVSYTWFTDAIRNGWYQIRVEVTSNGGSSAASHLNVKVDNAPQTPLNLTSSVTDQTVSLSWTPNPEPDLTGYRVERASGDTWTTVTQTQATSYTAELAPGSYQFRVIAFRSSPSMPEGRPSDPTAPVTLTVEAPPVSSGGVGGGGGKGGRGAVGGGDPRVYGRDGAASTRDVKETARAFSSSGLSFGGISLPGQGGLPKLPQAKPFEWGTYEEELPYSLPEGGIPLESAQPRLAALSTTTIIPMDALRWVGAGALMIVLAILLQFFGWRAETMAKLGAEGAAALKLSVPKISMPAVSLSDAHVRLRRIQDRVRTTWAKARSR